MAGINLRVEFNEKGSGAIGASFTNLNDEPVTPNTFKWTLSDLEGNIINNRSEVLVTPASTVWVLLKGDDLLINSSKNRRTFTIQGTFELVLDGVTYSNTPYTVEYEFGLRDLLNIN